jgi:hypothetical protein
MLSSEVDTTAAKDVVWPEIAMFKSVFRHSDGQFGRETQLFRLTPNNIQTLSPSSARESDNVSTFQTTVHAGNHWQIYDFGSPVAIAKMQFLKYTKRLQGATVVVCTERSAFDESILWSKSYERFWDEQPGDVYLGIAAVSDSGPALANLSPIDFCYPVLLRNGHFYRNLPIAFAMAGGLQRAAQADYCGMRGCVSQVQPCNGDLVLSTPS